MVVPSMTMIAVLNAVVSVQAQPVFADNAPEAYNPGVEEIRAVARHNTKAIVICHTFGVPANIVSMRQLCDENGWFLFEDVSECLGVRIRCSSNTGESLRRLGSFGDFSCGSLYANKIVSAGDGGFVGATDRSFQSKLHRFVNHGFTGSYHFLHFESAPNAKINGLGAALACGALENIQEVLDHRSMVSAVYRSELQHLVSAKLIPECGVDDTPWVFGVVAPSKAFRSRMRRMLARRGIESRDYFFSNSLQPAFTTTSPSCPEAHALGSRGFYLPTHVCLTRDDVRTIAACVESCWELVVAGVDKFEFRRQVDRVVRSLSVRVALCASESGLEVLEYNYSGEVACTYNKQHHPLLRLQTLVQQMRQFFASSESSEEARRLHQEASCLLQKLACSGCAVSGRGAKRLTEYMRYPPIASPWTHTALVSSPVETTTEEETIVKFLCWLCKMFEPCVFLEMGCFLGGTTVQVASATPGGKVFAVDSFVWEEWKTDSGVILYPRGMLNRAERWCPFVLIAATSTLMELPQSAPPSCRTILHVVVLLMLTSWISHMMTGSSKQCGRG